MKFARKFRVFWNNGVSRIVYAANYAQSCNLIQYFKDWAKTHNYAEPNFEILAEGYDTSFFKYGVCL